MFDTKPKRVKFDPNKARQQKVKAFGPPIIKRRGANHSSPDAKLFKEDLLWKKRYLEKRLAEIDKLFNSGRFKRPDGKRSCTVFEMELRSEETALQGMSANIDEAIKIARLADDMPKRKAALDRECEVRLANAIGAIGIFERNAEFRDATLHRLELPNLRANIRDQLFRYGG